MCDFEPPPPQKTIKSHKLEWKIKITEFYTIKGMNAAYMCTITEIQKRSKFKFLIMIDQRPKYSIINE